MACSQVLDIQDAHVDATLGGSHNAGASGRTSVADSGAPNQGGNDAIAGGSSGQSSAGMANSMAGTATSMAGAPDEPDSCESYCDAVISNCKGKYEQYRNFDQCIAVCKRLPHGATGDENVNSVECRMRQAHFAESEPFVYCKSAGPLGAGKCGSNCVSYCSLMGTACTADSTAGNLEPSYFASSQQCLSVCGGLPADPTGPTQYSSSSTVEPSSFVGNNVFCRTYHLAAGLEQDTPTEHCPHAMGGDPCNQQ